MVSLNNAQLSQDDISHDFYTEGMEGVAKVVPFAATGPKATTTQQAFIRALLLAQTAEGYKSLCRTIANAKRPRYEDIKCPLLIIAGSHDKTAPLTGSQEILNRYAHDSFPLKTTSCQMC